jgi:hypothetical protein
MLNSNRTHSSNGPVRPRMALCIAAALPLALLLCSCGSGSNSDLPMIVTQPASQVVTLGKSATFNVSATDSQPLTYQWLEDGANIPGATSASYTTPATAASDNGAIFQVQVSTADESVFSNPATLTVALAPGAPTPVSVLTYHNDLARTGQNLSETALTPTNVSSSTFGKLGFLTTTGSVHAEPLYVPNLTIGGSAHNVLFVATEADRVYAFDADTFAQLWQVSLLGSGETTSDDRGCSDFSPEIGAMATPVIDPAAGADGTIFLAAMSKDSSGNYYQRVHALDLTTGAEQPGSPATVQASYPNTSGGTTFDPGQYSERAALLLLNGVVYTTWTSHCDDTPYTGWVMGYSESTLQPTMLLNVTPNGKQGAIWMSGGGPAADSSGYIYFLDANGTFDTTLNGTGFPINADFGNSFLKLSTAGGTLSVADYFTMSDTGTESSGDEDLGAGGAVVLPDLQNSAGSTVHLAVGAGKDGNIYVVNRDSMGKFSPNNDDAIYQEIDRALTGGASSTPGTPAYFNNTVYYGGSGDALKAFPITNAKLATSAASNSPEQFGFPGATPGISANGALNGIVWAIENGSTAVLRAYDANNLATEFYNSNQAANNRDQFTDGHFVTPMISNGKVYAGTPTGVAVFGLLGK